RAHPARGQDQRGRLRPVPVEAALWEARPWTDRTLARLGPDDGASWHTDATSGGIFPRMFPARRRTSGAGCGRGAWRRTVGARRTDGARRRTDGARRRTAAADGSGDGRARRGHGSGAARLRTGGAWRPAGGRGGAAAGRG